jgi:hypothetical protein
MTPSWAVGLTVDFLARTAETIGGSVRYERSVSVDVFNASATVEAMRRGKVVTSI